MYFRFVVLHWITVVIGAMHFVAVASHVAPSQNSQNSVNQDSTAVPANKTCLTQPHATFGIECELLDASVLTASAFGSSSSSNSNNAADGSILSVSGTANISTTDTGQVQINSNMNVAQTAANCPSLENADKLTQTQLINRLTAPCRYDRLQRPGVLYNGSITFGLPVQVYVRAYLYTIQVQESNELQFKVLGLLQLRFADPRLSFKEYAPQRSQPIIGESQLRERVWIPHIFLANEHSSAVLGTSEKDILTVIAPDGNVVISTRIQAALSCWMDLRKFPFDEQQCSAILESWMYNISEVQLRWEPQLPLAVDPKTHLTEYILQDVWSNETVIDANLEDLRRGAFIGNYSSLSFTVYLTRESGFYIMDYFLPSMMIVAISWVSFWLQADQTPARTTLGTSTMLSFITLASTQEKNLPKVSYIKISEVWFFACTFFIFGSLMEFAFVNTIWRRNRNLELRKVNSKNILKSTLTPRTTRKSARADAELCCADSIASTGGPSIIITDCDVQLRKFDSQNSAASSSTTEETPDATEETSRFGNHSWSTMTPHEVSLWIDRKARFVFPLAFILFNAIFWASVYCM